MSVCGDVIAAAVRSQVHGRRVRWSRLFLLAGVGMAFVKQQFFPTSDRPEVLVDVQMPEGTSIEATAAAAVKVEAWLSKQPEAKIVTTLHRPGRAPLLLLL